MIAGELAIPRHEPELTTTRSGPRRFSETIRRQFRQVMGRLTQPAALKPKARKRRTDEVQGGFKLAAINFAKHAIRAARFPTPIWDALTWLRYWELDESAAINDFYSNPAPGSTSNSVDRFPRP